MSDLSRAAAAAAAFAALTIALGRAPAIAQETSTPHTIGAAKLIITDVKLNQAFYEQMFGMKEVKHYSVKDLYDEPVMGFENGARLALFSPLAEPGLKKSQFPVALILTPDLDAVVKRLQDAKSPVRRLEAAQAGSMQIAIARDPSGNAIELLSRPGNWEVGGSKLIVDDRQKAEDFFIKLFGVKVERRFQTSTYEEVVMSFGSGPILALFQPLTEPSLPKSNYPVVAIYTSDFDGVLKRVTEAGYGYREVKSADARIIVAKDPAGNAVEIIQRAASTAH